MASIEAVNNRVLNATFNGNTNSFHTEDENSHPLIVNSEGAITFRAAQA